MSQIPYSKRISYALPDVGGQLVFYTIGCFLLKFYTDVYGISAAMAGLLMFIPRITDAIDAPIWGIIFDKTKTRWGKHRPWFLWLCVPFSVFGVLTFLTPDLGDTAKVWYSGITLVICNILYTGINTPVTSILSALTADPRDRVMMTCWRMFGSKLGVLIVGQATLRLVNFFGDGKDQKLGYAITMMLYAAIAIVMFLIAFKNLDENAVTEEEQKPLPIKDSIGAAKGNWPWVIICISSLLFWIGFIARIASVLFFFEYVIHDKTGNLSSWVFTMDSISLVTVLFLPWFCKLTSKRNVWFIGLLGMALGQLIIYAGLRDGNSVPLIMAGFAFGYLASGMAMAMPFSILSDSVDYGEWKTGIRAPGFLTAIGAAFCLKAGIGMGAALPAWILAWTGYVANAVQTPQAIFGIELAIIWVPMACFVLAAIPVFFYKKYEDMEPRIHADLDRRRAETAASQ